MQAVRRIKACLCAAAILSCALLTGCSLFSKPTPDLPAHLIAESEVEAQPIRAVSAREPKPVTGEGKREQIDAMLEIVAEGYRPTFNEAMATAQQVYDKAIAILDRYMLNDFSEYERVHAIHDYLASTVAYDIALYEKYLAHEDVTDEHPSFHLEGALLEGNAVCDGFSKAFMFLCNLEGIACVRITGAFDAQAHAWNKVRLENRWYNVDVTMDKGYYSIRKGTTFVLHHGYFLRSDRSMTAGLFGRHTFGRDNPSDEEANEDYDYYATAHTDIDGVSYGSLVTSKRQLLDIFAAVKASKRAVGKLELRLSIAGVNADSSSAFASMIEEAYKSVKSDFVYDPARGYLPYLRYPNGVFVFLIYK